MQHQPHEPFFSFSVPPKPDSANLQLYSSPVSHQHNVLSSIVTDPDHPSHLQLSSRSPSSASPTLNRPNTAGRFAFNISSSSDTPPSALPRHSPNQLPTSTPSVATSLDRPYSSSGLPPTPHFPQTVSNSQTFGSSHAASAHDALKSAACSSFSSLASHSGLFTTPNNASRYAIPNQHTRPMTAPGPGGRHDLGDESEFSSTHAALLGRMSSYPPQPTDLSSSDISQPAVNRAGPCPSNHLVHSSPDSSSLFAGFGDTSGRDPLRSSSGSSDPDSRIPLSNSGEYHAHPNSPHRGVSGSGRPSVGTRSSESSPASPESLDAEHSHPQSYLHSLSSDHFHHQLLRPNTHSGASTPFGEERFLPQSLHPRPATGYLHHYEPPSAYASVHPQCHQYPPRMSVYSAHSSQIYAPGPGHYAHGPGSTGLKGHDRLYNFNILPGAPRKRARRRFDEVERLYCCNYPGCTKAYGTLNHLNAHISMQKHGPKRLPQEFKEIRKEWRARKKAETEARSAMKHSSGSVAAGPDYSAFASQEAYRRPNTGAGCNSRPPSSSACGGFNHISPPAVSGSYSAPASSQQFTIMDRQNEWQNDYRINPATIDEHPEYIGSSSSHGSPGALFPNHSLASSNSPGAPSYADPLYPHHVIIPPSLQSTNRSGHVLINNNPSPAVVDQS